MSYMRPWWGILPVDFGPARERCGECDGTGKVTPDEFEGEETCWVCEGIGLAWSVDLYGESDTEGQPTLFALEREA